MDSKLKDVKPYFYFDKKAKMLLCNNFQGWKQDDKGTTDSLWRTGIAHICYPENHSIKSGLLEAFRLRPDGKFQACRCNPMLGEHDVSRDQVIMSMSALKINSTSPISKIILKKIARGLPYKLSNRYNMTPNLWLWLRGITGNPIADYLNQIYMIIELIISVSLNKFINWQIKPTYCRQNRLEYLLSTVGEEKLRATKLNTKWKKFLWLDIKLRDCGLVDCIVNLHLKI